MHDGARFEPVLVAYGITTAGDPIFVHLDGVSAESTDACVDFLESIVARRLKVAPVLVISDGAPGLCAALDLVFPDARRQRCLIHRSRNVLARVSEVDQDAVKADFWDIFDIGDDIDEGAPAVVEATRRAEQFTATWGASYPRAVECLQDGFELLTSHLHYPRAHWTRVRHTNLIERTFGESRRRVKVIGRLPGERSALSLLWAVLDRAATGWRGITYTPADVRQLQMIRRDLGLTRSKKHRPDDTPRDVTAAA